MRSGRSQERLASLKKANALRTPSSLFSSLTQWFPGADWRNDLTSSEGGHHPTRRGPEAPRGGEVIRWSSFSLFSLSPHSGYRLYFPAKKKKKSITSLFGNQMLLYTLEEQRDLKVPRAEPGTVIHTHLFRGKFDRRRACAVQAEPPGWVLGGAHSEERSLFLPFAKNGTSPQFSLINSATSRPRHFRQLPRSAGCSGEVRPPKGDWSF